MEDFDKGKKIFVQVCPMPHCQEGGQEQDQPQSELVLWLQDWSVSQILLHRYQQKQRYHLGRIYVDGILGKPQEVYPSKKIIFPGIKKKAERDDLIVHVNKAMNE
ncbi:cytochrome c-like [Dromiciops gliroides]|uniref:cytochrome c-like n=1 Tax=Dromiciops gliroides TaxID=33562 RepID=UPI001CC5E17B|nr:cytochrome c-like [Dromiciops gliroides]